MTNDNKKKIKNIKKIKKSQGNAKLIAIFFPRVILG